MQRLCLTEGEEIHLYTKSGSGQRFWERKKKKSGGWVIKQKYNLRIRQFADACKAGDLSKRQYMGYKVLAEGDR